MKLLVESKITDVRTWILIQAFWAVTPHLKHTRLLLQCLLGKYLPVYFSWDESCSCHNTKYRNTSFSLTGMSVHPNLSTLPVR